MFSIRDLETFEAPEVFQEAQLWAHRHWSKDEVAPFGFDELQGTAQAEAAFFACLFRDDDLTLFRHVHDNHGRKLLPGSWPDKRRRRFLTQRRGDAKAQPKRFLTAKNAEREPEFLTAKYAKYAKTDLTAKNAKSAETGSLGGRKSLKRVYFRGDSPTMIVRADDRRRVVLPGAKPGDSFAVRVFRG